MNSNGKKNSALREESKGKPKMVRYIVIDSSEGDDDISDRGYGPPLIQDQQGYKAYIEDTIKDAKNFLKD